MRGTETETGTHGHTNTIDISRTKHRVCLGSLSLYLGLNLTQAGKEMLLWGSRLTCVQ